MTPSSPSGVSILLHLNVFSSTFSPQSSERSALSLSHTVQVYSVKFHQKKPHVWNICQYQHTYTIWFSSKSFLYYLKSKESIPFSFFKLVSCLIKLQINCRIFLMGSLIHTRKFALPPTLNVTEILQRKRASFVLCCYIHSTCCKVQSLDRSDCLWFMREYSLWAKILRSLAIITSWWWGWWQRLHLSMFNSPHSCP